MGQRFIVDIKNEKSEVIARVEVLKFISEDSTTFDLLGAPGCILWEDNHGNYWLTDPAFSFNFDEVVAVKEAWEAEQEKLYIDRSEEYHGQ